MSNGSEAGSGACGVPLPGHMMPVGADALTEKGFRDWVASVHPVFVETKLADLLIEMGYDRVAVVGAIDEDMLRESFGVKRGHAPFSCSRLGLYENRWGYVRQARGQAW